MSNDRHPSQMPTVVVALCGVALGAFLAFLYYRLRHVQLAPGNGLGIDGGEDDYADGGDPIDALMPRPRGRAVKNGRGPDLLTAGPRARVVPVARTFTISDVQPSMLMQAVGRRDWTIWVRNVGPAGSFATFMIGNNPGNSVIVPAGGFQQMRIPHGEYLYAQGDTTGVIVSVSGGADT